MNISEIATDTKVAIVIATGTTSTGIGSVLDWIPDDVGKLATVVGIVLSVVLIRTHWRKGNLEYKRLRMEIALLKDKEAERLKAANRQDDDGA